MADGYDPRMLQMAQMGMRMMAPQPSPFDRTARQPQWWEQPQPAAGKGGNSIGDYPGQSANQPANSPKPPSMLDMMMGLGKLTRPEYDKRLQDSPPGQQQGMAMVSPWAWLGSMGMPGGAGWGGGKS